MIGRLTAAGWIAASITASVAGAAGCGGSGDATDSGPSCGPGSATGSGLSCGPGDAPGSGLLASSSVVSLNYGMLTGGLNNDCPASDAPPGVISMTIEGTPQSGQGRITLCVGRPDLLARQALSLGFDAAAPVRVIDLVGTDQTCTFTVDRTMPLAGTVQTSGLCCNGGGPAGFALVVDATLSLKRTCGATDDTTAVSLHGRVAVTTSK